MSAQLALSNIAMARPGAGGIAQGGIRRAVGGKRIRSIAMIAGDATPPHIPVLVGRVVAWLAVYDGGVYIDATFGAGGYTRAILHTAGAHVIGIDRDQGAIAR